MERFTIELDCEPGFVRPDGLLPGVLADTGLKPEDFTDGGRLFGNWTFILKDGKADLYKEVRGLIKARIEELYFRGAIRYGSW